MEISETDDTDNVLRLNMEFSETVCMLNRLGDSGVRQRHNEQESTAHPGHSHLSRLSLQRLSAPVACLNCRYFQVTLSDRRKCL